MLSNKDANLIVEEKTPIVRPGTYSPVTVHMGDTLGVLFLGILACLLLVQWIRAETRNRALMALIESTRHDQCIAQPANF